MSTDVGRGILAPRSGANIRDGAAEMRTLGATAAAAINTVDLQVSAELAQKIGKTEAYENLVPRDEAARYGIPGPRGLVGPPSEVPGPPGPGGSIALEETDPGCFVDSEITWMQWPQSGGLPAVWNPNTETYENPIRVDTSVGTRVFVGDTMIHGDTGPRDITSLVPGVISGRLLLARHERTVWLDFDELIVEDPASGNDWHQWRGLLPEGFRATRSFQYMAVTARPVRNSSSGPARVSATGELLVYDVLGQKEISALVSFPTRDPWPTVEPGTPYEG